MTIPVVLGAGRTLYAGVATRPMLRLKSSRAFASGRVYNVYEPRA